MTDEDEGIMAPLKAYLEATGSQVPEKLARHPAANANASNNFIT
jgi:ATP-dependent RNA helicase DDX23/PRP28